ncbi:MAG: hypothetical protein RLZZ292_1176 [Bacteroidota bacterium]
MLVKMYFCRKIILKMTGAIKNIQLTKEGNLPFEELLKSVSFLETPEIVQFMHEMGRIVAARKVVTLPTKENDLLKLISQSIPNKLQMRYEDLMAKRNSEVIGEVEYQELLRIVTKIEAKKAKKLEYMIELASLRSVSLKELAQQLQVNNPFYA